MLLILGVQRDIMILESFMAEVCVCVCVTYTFFLCGNFRAAPCGCEWLPLNLQHANKMSSGWPLHFTLWNIPVHNRHVTEYQYKEVPLYCMYAIVKDNVLYTYVYKSLKVDFEVDQLGTVYITVALVCTNNFSLLRTSGQ